ncbi:NUDIX hydrolase [Vitreoscilla filiformis]|uniref:NUDIX hydrolase n=1 Tax=Vitreoscilla filiformis TaxID=63 RepID=A0A221KCA9_VITFI|nr:MBL fold metallo-hydrolase [Vitreoscilla filiformis]ASM76662.1 NUDIX hydrolase [Vitreoscilla filiformis]
MKRDDAMMLEPLSADELAQAAEGARRAASVILLRDGAQGLEVLLLRRAEREGDQRSGIWVFPGGVLEDGDAPDVPSPADAALSARMGLPAGAWAYVNAAVRECAEEVAVSLDASALHYFAHWLTPHGIPKRFDTRFFLARMPADQVPRADLGEVTEWAWLSPTQALAPETQLKLLPVTRRLLRTLAGWACVADGLRWAEAQPAPVCHMPRLGRDARGVRPVLPEEPAWAEIGRLDPTGQGHVHADLQPLRIVRLAPCLRRVTCANGSVMTGPGTNTYVLGGPGQPAVVIDPGPDDAHTAAHLDAVLAAVDSLGATGVGHILVTHTHRDHSPAAQALKARTGARCVGRAAGHPQGQDMAFQPDVAVQDGDRFTPAPGCTLRALHTPGHASNHVCWLWEEDGLLFTGDHIMQSSTVIINPPDGDMGQYFTSLERLLDEPLTGLAPGHGFLMAHPHSEVRRILAHRLQREARVLAAITAHGRATVEALVPDVYGDVPPARHGLAARSLTAHLLKLAAQGQAYFDGDTWCRSADVQVRLAK